MVKQIGFILTLFLVMTISMATQCRKDHATSPRQYFTEDIILSPAKKVYQIKDTIWLNYETSDKTFYDEKSGKRLPSNGLRFGFGATLLPKYDTPENPSDGFCDFILPNNTKAEYYTNQSGTSTFFNIDCDSAPAYHIKLGIVLKYQGIYVLDLPSAIVLQACVGETNPYPSAGLQFFYGLDDCNKDIYLSIPPASRQEYPPGFTEAQIGDRVAYAVKVE